MPEGVSFDPVDDDIVIATALSARCSAIATLDHECAAHAHQVIDVLSPCQPECNRFFSTATTIDVPIFAGETEGFLQLDVLPLAGTAGRNGETRRYVFSTENGLAMWLNDSSGRYEVGLMDVEEPIWQFPGVPLDRTLSIAASFDCGGKRLIVGYGIDGSDEIVVRQVPARQLPPSIGKQIDILSRGGQGSFVGNWRGVLSAQKFLGASAVKFALRLKCHFEPLDAQRFRLEDAEFESTVTIVPDLAPAQVLAHNSEL